MDEWMNFACLKNEVIDCIELWFDPYSGCLAPQNTKTTAANQYKGGHFIESINRILCKNEINLG